MALAKKSEKIMQLSCIRVLALFILIKINVKNIVSITIKGNRKYLTLAFNKCQRANLCSIINAFFSNQKIIALLKVTYSDQQKHESSCLLSECLSCISPEPLELQKSYFYLFAFSTEELSDEISFFEIRWQNQLTFAKTKF